MRITEIREKTVPIASTLANAFIDFSNMTGSVVAVTTGVVRDGKPVTGYGFNSNGRYGQGALIRERFAPRILEAEPETLIDDQQNNLDPAKIWDRMMTNEKPGGHGERSVAVGTIDMAVWDAAAKIAERPLFELLAERYGSGIANPKIFVYAAGGYYYPDKGLKELKAEMRSYIERGYSVVKMKIGGVLEELRDGQKLAVDANGRFNRETALAYADALAKYPLFWFEEAGDPLDSELAKERPQ